MNDLSLTGQRYVMYKYPFPHYKLCSLDINLVKCLDKGHHLQQQVKVKQKRISPFCWVIKNCCVVNT